MHSQNYKGPVCDQTSECNKPITWSEVPDQATWEKIKWSVTILAVIMGSVSVIFFFLPPSFVTTQSPTVPQWANMTGMECTSKSTGSQHHVAGWICFRDRKLSSTARLCIYLCTGSVMERESERESAARSVTTQPRDVSAFTASISVSQECIPASLMPSASSAKQRRTLMTKEMKLQHFLSKIQYYDE